MTPQQSGPLVRQRSEQFRRIRGTNPLASGGQIVGCVGTLHSGGPSRRPQSSPARQLMFGTVRGSTLKGTEVSFGIGSDRLLDSNCHFPLASS